MCWVMLALTCAYQMWSNRIPVAHIKHSDSCECQTPNDTYRCVGFFFSCLLQQLRERHEATQIHATLPSLITWDQEAGKKGQKFNLKRRVFCRRAHASAICVSTTVLFRWKRLFSWFQNESPRTFLLVYRKGESLFNIAFELKCCDSFICLCVEIRPTSAPFGAAASSLNG